MTERSEGMAGAPSSLEAIYLDNAATTPVRPEAVEAMLAFLGPRFANPSGSHRLARDARRGLDDAREELAAALGCRPGEVVLTSGGTEADDLAVHGALAAAGAAPAGAVAVATATEHHAVLHPVEAAGGMLVGVDERGVIDLAALDATLVELGSRVAVVSVHLVNNETGTVQPLAAVVERVRERCPGALVHTDAVQALPWLDLAAATTDADLVSVSAHKFGGPKGVGALVVRDGVRLVPRLLGGGQERGRRSGTSPVALVAAMAVAAGIAVAERADVVARIGAERARLVAGLAATVGDLVETGVGSAGPRAPAPDRAHKIAGAAPLCIPGVESEALLFLLDEAGICASAASSCSSGAQQASHVLAAMGVPAGLARGALRLSLGPTTTAADVDAALAVIPPAVARLRRSAA